MTERRPHWDDDLVDGVGRRLIPLYRSIGYCTDAERHRIYTLIEFIEDWQDRTQQARAMSITDNEAAIQRVRELCEAKTQEVAASDPLFGPPRALYVDDILRALDGWTLAPGTPYDHPATALDWCPNCTTIRSDLAVAMQRVRELHRHRMGSRYYVCAECGDNVPYPCATRRLVDDDPWAFLRALDGGTE